MIKAKLAGVGLALGLGAAAMLGQPAPAMAAAADGPMTPRIDRSADTFEVAQNYDQRRHGPRYRDRRPGYGYFWDGYWYRHPWWRQGRYHHPAPRGHSAHVRWCHWRYQSYNPARDAFRGYDGRWHRCISPYRR